MLALGLLVVAGAFAQKIDIESDQAADFSGFIRSPSVKDG